VAQAVRLRLSVEGESLRVRSSTRVDTLVPASDPIDMPGEVGFWVEVHDNEGQTVYRRVLRDYLQDTVELFSEDPNETIVRRPSARAQGEFVVIVPDIGRGASAAFYGSPSERGRALRRAHEIARIQLDEELSAS
jgi:hypothetical protein